MRLLEVKKVRLRINAFRGDNEIELGFPESWDVTECRMAGHDMPPLSDDEMRSALQNSIGSPSLREMAKGAKKVCIIFDDICRPTPASRIIPFVVEELQAGGVADEQIRFLSAQGNHQIPTHPELATETGVAHKWERSPDALDWTFHLREGIKFHDGVELTAKDVKFTIEQLAEPGALSDATSDLRKDLKNIEMKDPHTVVIHLKQPNIFLPNILRDGGLTGMVVPKDYYEKVGKDGFAKRPMGSGPYKWHSQMVDSFIKLEAMEKHWRDGVPRYKYMTFVTIPEESTRLAMLRTGEADITSVSRDAVKEALNAGLSVHTRGYVQAVVLHPGMQWTSLFPFHGDILFAA